MFVVLELLTRYIAADHSTLIFYPNFQFFGDTTKIILKIAADCEEKGLFEDAISLYDLGKRPMIFLTFQTYR